PVGTGGASGTRQSEVPDRRQSSISAGWGAGTIRPGPPLAGRFGGDQNTKLSSPTIASNDRRSSRQQDTFIRPGGPRKYRSGRSGRSGSEVSTHSTTSVRPR